MTLSMQDENRIIKHVWTEPKFVAQVQFLRDYPPLGSQLMEQVPRHELVEYIDTGEHPHPERVIEYVPPPPMPDWDWWEPRHDQPWRRQAARDRGESA